MASAPSATAPEETTIICRPANTSGGDVFNERKDAAQRNRRLPH